MKTKPGFTVRMTIERPALEVYMPMRVFPNGEGAEVLLTVFRQPGMTEEKFVDDTQWVRRDLEALKALLEK